MAAVIAPLPSFAPKGSLRGEKSKVFTITPDASKPAAGYTILASDLGLSYLDFGKCSDVGDGSVYVAAFKIDTASTKGTLQYYQFLAASVAASAGTVGVMTAVGASDTKLTTNPVSILVVGR